MANYVIFGQTADNYVESHGTSGLYTSAEYLRTRAGATMSIGSPSATTFRVGQTQGESGATYYACYEAFISFDTSAVPGTEFVNVTSLSLSAISPVYSAVIDVFADNWGTAVSGSSYVPGATLQGMSAVGSAPANAFTNVPLTPITPSTATRYLLSAHQMVIGDMAASPQQFPSTYYSADQSGTAWDPALSLSTISVAPYAPTLTQPVNFDPSINQTLAWQFHAPSPSDYQSYYRLVITDYATGAVVVDTGQVMSAALSQVITAGTLTNQPYMQWWVSTWGSAGTAGPASAPQIFSTSAKPTVALTAPSAPLAATSFNYYDVAWTYSQADASPQASYQLVLTRTSNGAVLYDSGLVTSSATAQRVPNLLGSVSCTITLTATSAFGIASAPVSQTIYATYDVPDTPTIVATPSGGGIQIAITNPTPTGSRSYPSYNQLWSTNVGNGHHGLPDGYPGYQTFGAYFLLLDLIPINTPVYDYGVVAGAAAGGPGLSETYFVRAVK